MVFLLVIVSGYKQKRRWYILLFQQPLSSTSIFLLKTVTIIHIISVSVYVVKNFIDS